jgi:hypothetical protein
MLSNAKVLLSKPLTCKKIDGGGRNWAFLIIPAFLILFLIPLNPCYSQTFQPNPDSIPFASAVNYPVGDYPLSVFCADLNGDGHFDLAVPNALSDSISILMNNGDGTFLPAVNYPAGDEPNDVFCADLDGDSNLDLAVTNGFDSTISIFKNWGNGTFLERVDYPVGARPFSVYCADLDRDSDLDLALAHLGHGESIPYICILKNYGNGTFQDTVCYLAGNSSASVFCAYLDADSALDIAVTVPWDNKVSIFKNDGNGGFPTRDDYPTGLSSAPFSVFCSDLDGDKDFDLAVACTYSDSVSIFKNNGDGIFQARVDYNVGRYPASVFCADLDGDTDLDLAVANRDDNNISILKNNREGIFQNKVDYSVGYGPVSVFCADLDGDGDLDLAVANPFSDNVSILLNLSNKARPNSFSLISPDSLDSIKTTDYLTWQKAIDPDSTDTVRYDLYISRFPNFYPDSIVYDGLLDTLFMDSLGPGLWYWKVKAYDKWGAIRWSNETWTFWVLSPPDSFSLISPPDKDSTRTKISNRTITLTWHKAVDPDPNDTVLYDLYLSRSDFNVDSTVYDSLPDTTFTDILDFTDPIDIKLWYWKVKAYDKWGAVTWSNQTWSFYVYLCGDCNGDRVVQLGDVVYIISYQYKNGLPPVPLLAGDCNCSGVVELGDVVYLISFLYRGGDKPCKYCK